MYFFYIYKLQTFPYDERKGALATELVLFTYSPKKQAIEEDLQFLTHYGTLVRIGLNILAR
ncbi:hypothetical protein [Halobacillus mangrovi]|uniref:hypothetical protein n=1 Tax=Halobacillus mangrovi TaxID=402384 RepID=UPI003D95244A